MKHSPYRGGEAVAINTVLLVSLSLFKRFGLGKSKDKRPKPSRRKLDQKRQQASELKAIINEIVEDLESMQTRPTSGASGHGGYDDGPWEDEFTGRTKELGDFELKEPTERALEPGDETPARPRQRPRPTDESVVEFDESKFFQLEPKTVDISKERIEPKTKRKVRPDVEWDESEPETEPEVDELLFKLEETELESEILEFEPDPELDRGEAGLEQVTLKKVGFEPPPEPTGEPTESGAKEIHETHEPIDEYLEKAMRYKERNQYHDAMTYFDKVLALDPDHIDALNNKGLILWLNKKYRLAMEQFYHVLDIDPENKDVIINIAASLSRLGKKEKALRMYDELLARDPVNGDALSNKGVILFSQRKFEAAQECFRLAVEHNPHDVELLFNFGCSLEKLRKFDEAVKTYERILELDPHHDQARRAHEQCLKEHRFDMLSQIIKQ